MESSASSYILNLIRVFIFLLNYLSMFRRQCGFFSPTQSSFTPESIKALLLRSSSLRQEFINCRTEDKLSQH